MKNYSILLLSLSGILILINFLLLSAFEPEIHRWGRFISTLSLMVFFLKDFRRKKFLLLIIFILFLTADLISLKFKDVVMQKVFFVLQSLAYILLFFRIGRYLIKPKLKQYQKLYFLLVFLLNSAFVIIIGDMLAEEVQNTMLQILFYVLGFSTVFFISGGILYYDRFPNYLSTAFLFAVAGLVLSNLMGFSAHYLEFTNFYYADRFFYVLGMAGLVAYSYYFDMLQTSTSAEKSGSTEENLSRRLKDHESVDEYAEEHDYL